CPRVIFLRFGSPAITSLGIAYTEAIALPYGLHYAVVPAAAVMFLLGLRYPAGGQRAPVGLVPGMIAPGLYDCLRVGLVFAGLWGAPIPGIGRMALADPNAAPYWGYVWRFIGN